MNTKNSFGLSSMGLRAFELCPAALYASLLIACSASAGTENTKKADESSNVAAKPLWALTPDKIANPLKGAFGVNCLGSNPEGGLLLQLNDAADLSRGPLYVLVEPQSGKTIRRIETTRKPGETVEWTSGARWLPDGRFLHIGVTRGLLKDEEKSDSRPQGKVHVGINVRLINTTTGGMLERMIPFDDPSGEGMSKGFCSWSGQVCVESKFCGERLLVSNQYFVAELDPASLKTMRSLNPPDIKGFRTPGDYLVKNGRIWVIQTGEEGGDKYYLTEFDKQPREISLNEMKQIFASRKIEEVAHAKCKEAKFFARENGVGNDLIHQDGAKLHIAYKESKSMEVNLGASNADSTVWLQQLDNLILIHVLGESGGQRKSVYHGIMAVRPPSD